MAVSCKSDDYKLDRIENFSKVIFPNHSKILIYNDNLDIEIAFKIHIEKKQLNVFLDNYNFKQIDTIKKNPLLKNTSDENLIYNIENGFVPREKIFGNNIRIFKSKRVTMVVNVDNSILWGLVNK